MTSIYQHTRPSARFSLWELCLILILLHEQPFVGFITPSILFAGIVALFYMSVIYENGFVKSANYIILSLPIISIGLLNVLLKFFGDSPDISKDIYGLLQDLIYPIAALTILEKKRYATSKFLFYFFIIISCVTCVTTIIGNQLIPGASRSLAGSIQEGDADFGVLKLMNVGGFSFAYILVSTVPLMILSYKRRRKSFDAIASLLILALIAVTLKYMDYTMAILLMAVSLIFIFLPQTLSRTRVLIIVVFIILLMEVILPLVLSFLQSVIGVEGSSFDKLADLSLFFEGGSSELSTDSDVYQRSYTIKKSLSAFLDSPIFGTWSPETIGGHSFFWDSLALFGLIGLAAIFLIYKRIYSVLYAQFQKESWFGHIFWAFLLSIVMMFFNTHIYWLLFTLITPVYCLMLSDNNQEELKEDATEESAEADL